MKKITSGIQIRSSFDNLLSLDNLFWFLLIFVAGMILAQFVVGIRLSTVGVKLTLLEKEWRELVLENQKLREEIALHTSLSQISSLSAQFGLAKPGEIIYLTSRQTQANLSSPEKP